MNNTPLIDDLVADLKPVKPLKDNSLLALSCFGFIGVLLFVFSSIGFRIDLADAFENGTLWWKNGGLFLGIICSLYVVLKTARPQIQNLNLAIIPAIILIGLILSQFMPLIENKIFMKEMLNINMGGWQMCLGTTLFGSLAIFTIMWNFWLKNTASNNPRLLGFASGALSALLAAFAYSFHCNMDGVFYYLICYWIPIFAIAMLGFFMGNRLKW